MIPLPTVSKNYESTPTHMHFSLQESRVEIFHRAIEDVNRCSTHHLLACLQFELQCPTLSYFNGHIAGQIGAHHHAIWSDG